jgi:hypothetical protein
MAHRILVLANKTCPCPSLRARIEQLAAEHADSEVLIVAPALNSRLDHFFNDTSRAVRAARLRLDESVAALRADGVLVFGQVGPASPRVALSDAYAEWAPHLILISTHPEGDSHWLAKHLLEDAARLPVPVEHFVTEFGVRETDEERLAQPAG